MITVLCVTRGAPRTERFLAAMEALAYILEGQFVIALDGTTLPRSYDARVLLVRSKGYFGSVLNEAVEACDGDYILRIDDDERPSPAMVEWLSDEMNWCSSDNWSFPRQCFWQNEQQYLVTPPWYPDYQTRFSVKSKSANRPLPHDPSPYGFGAFATVAIEHHELLVKDFEERWQFFQSLSRARGYDMPDAEAKAWQPESWPDCVQVRPYAKGRT